jgi:hypothetical protein
MGNDLEELAMRRTTKDEGQVGPLSNAVGDPTHNPPDDRERRVRRLLKDPETADKTELWIANQARVSPELVRRFRESPDGTNNGAVGSAPHKSRVRPRPKAEPMNQPEGILARFDRVMSVRDDAEEAILLARCGEIRRRLDHRQQRQFDDAAIFQSQLQKLDSFRKFKGEARILVKERSKGRVADPFYRIFEQFAFAPDPWLWRICRSCQRRRLDHYKRSLSSLVDTACKKCRGDGFYIPRT